MSNASNAKKLTNVEITYWMQWGYLSLASSLAAAIKKEFSFTVDLKQGQKGLFEVTVDDELIYTNNAVCCLLPKEEEVLGKIREREG